MRHTARPRSPSNRSSSSAGGARECSSTFGRDCVRRLNQIVEIANEHGIDIRTQPVRSISEMIVDGLKLLGITAFSLMLTAFLLPPLEEGREHARKTQARIMARRLASEVDGLSWESVSDELDPWGQPYRVVSRPAGGVRVISSGPNGTSPGDELDADDIYSDMPQSPNAAEDRRHHFRMLFALGVGAAVWIGLLILRTRQVI